MKSMDRRTFLRAAGAGGAALAVPNIITSKALGAADGTPPASERVVMAGIGMGGRGSGVLGEFMRDPRVQVVAVCDVKYGELKRWEKKEDVKTYVDYREICARDDIDAIMCATPDHWHAQVTIDAMKSGKDVFCEKPLTLTIREGRKMVETARACGRVFSSGSQRVIGDYGSQSAAANSGRYGEVLEAHVSVGGPSRHCYLEGVPIPPNTIEWDLWLGPAPWAPYHPFRCGRAYGLSGKGFRTWYDYSGGMMTDWGGHKFGGAMHGLQVDHTGPTHIYYPDGKNHKVLTYEFADGKKICLSGGIAGVKYICEKGEARPIGRFKVPPGMRWYEDGANSPVTDLINCIYNRRRPFRDVEYAHRVATVCHLGNICLMLKRDLRWDPEKEDFVNDAQASRLVDRPRRGPWQI